MTTQDANAAANADAAAPATALVAMDLADLDTSELANSGVEMSVRHPATLQPMLNVDDKTPMTIRVASSDSTKFVGASRAARNRRAAVGGRRGGPASARAEEIDADGIELIVAVTLGWNLCLDGKRPACNAVEARKLYLRFPWLLRQVDSFIAEEANFLKDSAKV